MLLVLVLASDIADDTDIDNARRRRVWGRTRNRESRRPACTIKYVGSICATAAQNPHRLNPRVPVDARDTGAIVAGSADDAGDKSTVPVAICGGGERRRAESSGAAIAGIGGVGVGSVAVG